jgi:3-(3-hydroxy-phenyl)propionate hydroxylase
LGARFIALRPLTQLHWAGHDDPDVVVVGDATGELKAWFDTHAESVLFLRPDRCVAGAGIAQLAPELSAALLDILAITPEGGERHRGSSPVLHVAQPAAESAGTVG